MNSKLLHEHEIEYLKTETLENHDIGGHRFWHYIDCMKSTVAFEVETDLCRKPFLIEFDKTDHLPSSSRAIWKL